MLDALNLVEKGNMYPSDNKVKIGMTGNDLYQKIETILPKDKYGWTLCPGHLTSYEEWMSTPVYEGSTE
jgi:hypothetical protein